MSDLAQPWPDGTEPGNCGALDMGTVKEPGTECAREWPDGAPGADYYTPPPSDGSTARKGQEGET